MQMSFLTKWYMRIMLLCLKKYITGFSEVEKKENNAFEYKLHFQNLQILHFVSITWTF